MKDWNWKGILVSLFLVGVLLVVPAVMVAEGRKIGKSSEGMDLPRIELYLNEATLTEIYENGKEIKYPGNRVIVSDGGESIKHRNVEVKGRGNATWAQVKKPLQLRFENKVDLVGLGKRRKWILLANYLDPTNLRTDAVFYLERMIGERFAYDGRFVELYVDSGYEGMYYLTRAIEVGKGAVDLKDPLGVLVELDNVYGKLEDKYYVSGNGEVFTVKDAVAADNADEAMEGFLKDFDALEVAIRQREYGEIEKLIDIESFAKYYLISEFSANIDAYFTSMYFYKDGVSDKIHTGPAWDFDRSFTDGAVGADGELTGSMAADEYFDPNDQYWQWSRLYARLMEFPEFEASVRKVYDERMRGRKNEFLQYVIGQAERIARSAEKDGKRWQKGDYAQEVDKMLEWIDRRYEYLDIKWGDMRTLENVI